MKEKIKISNTILPPTKLTYNELMEKHKHLVSPTDWKINQLKKESGIR